MRVKATLLSTKLSARIVDREVKAEILSTAQLITKNSVPEVSLLSVDDWKKILDMKKNWVNIEFENNKISVPRENVLNAIDVNTKLESLDKLPDLGLVIACDIVKRHQGNIFVKKTKTKGFTLQISVPQID